MQAPTNEAVVSSESEDSDMGQQQQKNEEEEENKEKEKRNFIYITIAFVPNSTGDEESLVDKDGVVKEVIKGGTGKERPVEPALLTVIYKGYFLKTGEVFDTSDDKPAQLELGDPTRIDGLHVGLGSMVKGEKAKLTIKSHYAFRTDKKELKIPEKYESNKEVVKKRRVIYEVELIDFVPRVDVNRDRQIIKTIEKEGTGKKTPRQMDEIRSIIPIYLIVDVSVEQDGKTLYNKENWMLAIDSEEFPFGMKRIALSMKKGEKCFADIQAGFLERNEKVFCEAFKIDFKKDARVHMTMYNFMRVEDYFHDDSTLRKVYKRGKKDSNPYMESTVECLFLF